MESWIFALSPVKEKYPPFHRGFQFERWVTLPAYLAISLYLNDTSALGNTNILPANEAAVPVSPELVVPATAELSTKV